MRLCGFGFRFLKGVVIRLRVRDYHVYVCMCMRSVVSDDDDGNDGTYILAKRRKEGRSAASRPEMQQRRNLSGLKL